MMSELEKDMLGEEADHYPDPVVCPECGWNMKAMEHERETNLIGSYYECDGCGEII